MYDNRQANVKNGSLSQTGAADGDVTAHHTAVMPAKRQPEAGASILARGRIIGLAELLKKVLDLFGRQADAAIFDAEIDPIGLLLVLACDAQPDDALFGELGRVIQQVEQHLPDLG